MCRVKFYREMRRPVSFIVLVLVLIATVGFGQGSRSCTDIERQSLLLFEKGVIDPFGALSSWSGDDCCGWDGVFCNNMLSMGLDMRFKDISWVNGIPKALNNICTLKILDLRSVGLRQDLSIILDILSGCVADGLLVLKLSNNHIYGHLTDKLGRFKKLEILDLSRNNISGTIPASLGLLSNLSRLDMSRNLLEGVVSEIHFLNLTRLEFFMCSSNSKLALDVGPNWVPPFTLLWLDLSSWHLGQQFPRWLRSQKRLRVLDLPNTGISDVIPDWFWSLTSFWILNVSQNQIVGKLSDMQPDSFQLNAMIDLSSNYFEGELPAFSSHNLVVLDVSNNSFSGSISPFLCEPIYDYDSDDGYNVTKKLRLLNLGQNHFSGEIPDCWMNFHNLIALRLDNNNFTGNLPSSMGNLISLKSLHLRNNHLTGKLPQSLKNCTQLVTLDASQNKFVGRIPSFLGSKLSILSILSLRSNKFEGHIPKELCSLTSLQILDLAQNQLSGNIPKCIGNLSAMAAKVSFFSYKIMVHSTTYFVDDALLVIKGRMDGYSTILQFVNIIDLSQNAFSGDIPEQVTNLRELLSLNLSHNSLTGVIPENIGALQSIESLDFSANKLCGIIPQSTSSLTFLNHFNLSRNNLSGIIPTSTQIQSFSSSSFADNPGLCGAPLKNCTEEEPPPSDPQDEDGTDFKSEIYIAMAVGFVTSFWGFCGCLLLKRTWRIAYFRFLDEVKDHIYVVVVLKVRSLRAKLF